MTTPGQNWLIRILSILAIAGAMTGLVLHAQIAARVLGGAGTWQKAVVLIVFGIVIALCLGFEKESRKRLKMSRN